MEAQVDLNVYDLNEKGEHERQLETVTLSIEVVRNTQHAVVSIESEEGLVAKVILRDLRSAVAAFDAVRGQ